MEPAQMAHGQPLAVSQALFSGVASAIDPDVPFKGDEGYSEDARSQDDGDSTMGLEPRFPATSQALDPLHALYQAIQSLDETQRSEHAYNVLRTLRTSSIAAVIERLTPLLHLDPVAKLPPDITSLLFSYLEPPSLLQAARVSKAWRMRTLDTVLWREKFRREGWMLNMEEVRCFERKYPPAKALSRKATEEMVRRPKRPARDTDFARPSMTPAIPGDGMQDYEMQDVELDVPPPKLDRMDTSDTSHSTDSMSVRTSRQGSVGGDEMATNEARDPPVLTRSYSGGARVNFHHVYKQKRRLEDNWAKARFKSFQLPHRDHPEEAHSECVYTIQYAGNYLVSGSRDRTLRIWNLDTQQLVRRPLEGHKGSVLCLQFDASPAEDIIISGSSDTDVILWQFSTGKMLKRIQNAHRESVLNLKFDSRFLVTCSKDKMIKIWTRKALLPGHVDYPRKGVVGGGRCPAYVMDWAAIPSPLEIERLVDQGQIEAIAEYSLIMKIDDHGAAVNAVHIHQDQLVSASGDRALRMFDIHSGVRIATCKGHTKGIACVQYDGKRIVSGSSDNTIRIFDPKSQAEVACLKGHSKLVRTVQASFGDIPGSEEDLEKEARAADRAYFRARIAAENNRPRREREQDRARERPSPTVHMGPRRLEEHTALGAKLPPGGGGSPWARIVSGSYDETIIIWRKAADGRWVVGHTLQQADALQAAGGPLIAQSDQRPPTQRRMRVGGQPPHGAAAAGNGVGAGSSNPVVHPNPNVPNGIVPAQPQPAPSQDEQQPEAEAVMQNAEAPSHPNVLSAAVQDLNASWPPQAASASASPAIPQEAGVLLQSTGVQALVSTPLPPPHPPTNVMSTVPIMHGSLPTLASTSNAAGGHGPSHGTHELVAGATVGGVPARAATAAAAGAVAGARGHGAVGDPHAALAAAQAAVAAHAQANAGFVNARVFKLQFDARRIICCSQDPKIVGWDFANGDPEIEEVARFFGSPG